MLQSSLSGRTFQVLKTSRDNHVTQVSGCCCGCRVPRRESGWLSVRRDEMEGWECSFFTSRGCAGHDKASDRVLEAKPSAKSISK